MFYALTARIPCEFSTTASATRKDLGAVMVVVVLDVSGIGRERRLGEWIDTHSNKDRIDDDDR